MTKRLANSSGTRRLAPRLVLVVAAIAMAATPAASHDESLDLAGSDDRNGAADSIAFDKAFAPFAEPAAPGLRAEAVDITAIEPNREEVSENTSDLGIGVASFYGKRFHGRQTANGERYDMGELTAAHKTLPFGSRVRVINKANGREVVVRINDRGPFVRGRHIDLSRAAAEEIGMINSGHARVRMELLDS